MRIVCVVWVIKANLLNCATFMLRLLFMFPLLNLVSWKITEAFHFPSHCMTIIFPSSEECQNKIHKFSLNFPRSRAFFCAECLQNLKLPEKKKSEKKHFNYIESETPVFQAANRWVEGGNLSPNLWTDNVNSVFNDISLQSSTAVLFVRL